jgi:hypothetical protein
LPGQLAGEFHGGLGPLTVISIVIQPDNNAFGLEYVKGGRVLMQWQCV